MTSTLLAVPIMVICVIIAFFSVSEMGLLEFISKLIRTYFLDVSIKYQVNYDKVDRMQVLLGKIKANDHEIKLVKKTSIIDKDKIKNIQEKELISF